jgi:hypothetical protein
MPKKTGPGVRLHAGREPKGFGSRGMEVDNAKLPLT